VRDVISALTWHRAVDSVTLVGSRARGEAIELSDWDFKVETNDFRSVERSLVELVAPLGPLAQQWDRLSKRACYMLLLKEMGKVDLIFNEPWEPKGPWVVGSTTLPRIDDHFWDWTIWLAAKDRQGKRELVVSELRKMHEHLLGPLRVAQIPSSLPDAVGAYVGARAGAERQLAMALPRAVEDEVRRLLAEAGYAV